MLLLTFTLFFLPILANNIKLSSFSKKKKKKNYFKQIISHNTKRISILFPLIFDPYINSSNFYFIFAIGAIIYLFL